LSRCARRCGELLVRACKAQRMKCAHTQGCSRACVHVSMSACVCWRPARAHQRIAARRLGLTFSPRSHFEKSCTGRLSPTYLNALSFPVTTPHRQRHRQRHGHYWCTELSCERISGTLEYYWLVLRPKVRPVMAAPTLAKCTRESGQCRRKARQGKCGSAMAVNGNCAAHTGISFRRQR
jgi:hypothetical protein